MTLHFKKILFFFGILCLFVSIVFLFNSSDGLGDLSSKAVSQPKYSGTWKAGSWKVCSNPCIEKTQTRTVSCIKNGKTASSSLCDPKKKPSNTQPCTNKCTNSLCTGNVPANASLCTGDDATLAASTARSLVSTCTASKKCEYTCATNFVSQGGKCVPKCGIKTDGDIDIMFYESGFETRLDNATKITFVTDKTSVTGSYEIGGEKFVCDAGTMSQPFYPENMYVSASDKASHVLIECENGHSLRETITMNGVILEITKC